MKPLWFRIEAEYWFRLNDMHSIATGALREWLLLECQMQATRLIFWRITTFREQI